MGIESFIIMKFLIILFISVQAFSFSCLNSSRDKTPEQCFIEHLKNSKSFKNITEKQSFAYINNQGLVAGLNTNLMVNNASESKLFTSLLALNYFGADHKFETKIFIQGTKVHIEGSKDPTFGRKAIYRVMKKLNELGIKEISSLTYDENFYFAPEVLDNFRYTFVYNDTNTDKIYCTPYEHNKFARGFQKILLQRYLNTSKWSNTNILKSFSYVPSQQSIGKAKLQENYGSACSKVEIQPILEDFKSKNPRMSLPQMKIQIIEETNFNPLVANEDFVNTRKLITHSSTELRNIIRFANVHSANLIIDLLFNAIGGQEFVTKELQSAMTLLNVEKTEDFSIISGSGLRKKVIRSTKNHESVQNNHIVFESLENNKSSAKAVLALLDSYLRYSAALHNQLQWQPFQANYIIPSDTFNLSIQSFNMLLAGMEGTFASRGNNKFKGTFLVKTGTLNNTSSIVGTMNTNSGKRHFSIVMNYDPSLANAPSVTDARNIQNEFIQDLINLWGGAVKIEVDPNLISNSSKSKFNSFDSFHVENF